MPWEPDAETTLAIRSESHLKVRFIQQIHKDIEGKKHNHPHEQMVYILSGSFEYYIENESRILNKGDSVYIGSGKYHYCKSLSEGSLLDIFTPSREDFLY